MKHYWAGAADQTGLGAAISSTEEAPAALDGLAVTAATACMHAR